MTKINLKTAVFALGLLLTGCKSHGPNPRETKADFDTMSKDLKVTQTFSALMDKAEQGSSMEEYQVGYDYETGSDIAKDYRQAALWYQKSSDQGFAAGQWSLGLLYKNGQGVTQDNRKAYFWLSLASTAYASSCSESKSAFDCKMQREEIADRNNVASHLSTADLLNVQEQTSQFLTNHPKSF